MGLRNFFNLINKAVQPAMPQSSFEGLTELELETHLAIARYGDFELTDAIRPSYDLQIVPREGWRQDVHSDGIPVLLAACTRQKLFGVFMELVGTMGPYVDTVLETSHMTSDGEHRDLYREGIDLPVLQSLLWEYEDLLMNDGWTGIAVLEPDVRREIQLNEHKLLVAYGNDLSAEKDVLRNAGIAQNQHIKFITENEHIHSSSETYQRLCNALRCQLGLDDDYTP